MNKVYHTATQEDYNVLMEDLEAKGYAWCNTSSPTKMPVWGKYKEETCIQACIHVNKAKYLTFGDINYYQSGDYEIMEYKSPQKREEE